MDTILLAVTILSLALAVAMAFIVTKLMREEHARSDARVAALMAMAAVPAADAVPAAAASGASAPPVVPAVPQAASKPAAVPRPARLDDLEIRPAGDSVSSVPHLFEEQRTESPWGRRLAVIGGVAAVFAAIAFAFTSPRPRAAGAPAPAGAAQQAPVVDGAPLELVSLRHTQDAQRLSITGLVHNPRSGAPLSRVVATAFLFGPDGAFLTSSRAPLDFTTLSPGDESPFVVTIPVSGQVARYRIGFRTDEGRVIEHVDKRAPDALAQK